MNKSAIFIASCQHSGSTLLDMVLSTHPRVVGLGEVWLLLNDRTRPRYLAKGGALCSCGSRVQECAFWSGMLAYLETARGSSYGQRYARLIRHAREQFGQEVIISDSSKYVHALRPLLQAIDGQEMVELDVQPEDILVLNLIRDVRGYVCSIKRIEKIPEWRLDLLLRQFRIWYRQNLDMDRFLAQSGLEHLRVSYEELCFASAKVSAKIWHALGIPADAAQGMSASISHIAVGNRARHHEIKSKRLQYDPRWFEESVVQILYTSLPRVRAYNLNNVYSGLIRPGNADTHFEPTEH